MSNENNVSAEKTFADGRDQASIHPVSAREIPSPSPAFTLDDLYTEDDNAEIVGDNILSRIEVRKPHQQSFFMCHPTWRLSTRAVVDKRGTKETHYLIHKCLFPCSKSLEEDSVPVLVCACIDLKGKIFLWVIRKSKEDGGPSKHYATALEHVQLATTNWIRRFWIPGEGCHDKRVAKIADKPAWPEGITFQEVVVAGFGSRIITSEDAQILRELRGEESDA